MKSYAYAVAWILVFLLAAQLAAVDGYTWYLNSISQLAAQAYSRAWIMRAGFIGFGILVQVAGINRMRASGPWWYREIPIMLYGLAILLSGIFSAEPFLEGVSYSAAEAHLHGIFATVAGITLVAATLVYALTDEPVSRRRVHWIALLAISGISLLFGSLTAVAGATQRVLWAVGFAWLLYLGNKTGSALNTPHRG